MFPELKLEISAMRAHDCAVGRRELPVGDVTYLFTDVEGSTLLLEEFPTSQSEAIHRQRSLLTEAVEENEGVVFESVGDAVYAAFDGVASAVEAAAAAQLALLREDWAPLPAIRVRMAIHCGRVEARDGHYFGAPLYRCARLMSTAHGGQVLLSDAVQHRLDRPTDVLDLGVHRLKDLREPEHIFQLLHPELPSQFPPLRATSRSNNLPNEVTRLFGRGNELAQLRALLREPERRIVTLVGAGGSGKTRLALRAAAQLLEEFRDGVFFIDLAPLTEAAEVAGAAAAVLGVQEAAGRTLVESLAVHLAGKDLLLVFDNFEHVLDAATGVISELVATAPTFTVLVTSRIPLHVAGEHQFPVTPLAVPSSDAELTQSAAAPAVQLFVDRAAAIGISLTLDESISQTIAEICRGLDGLPLAIELAAARTRVLPPQALLDRLGQRLELLTSGPADLPQRQRTMRDSIAWSYDLLGEDEQRLFRALGIFRGGAGIDAAEAVHGGSALDRLTTLTEHGLVRTRWTPLGEPRYEMLDTIAEFARAQLDEAGEREGVRERHAAYFVNFAADVGPRLRDDDRPPWVLRLTDERDNIRAALAFFIERDRALEGMRLLGDLWMWFWLSISEGLDWARRVTALSSGTDPTPERAGALFLGACCAGGLGDQALARALADDAIAVARQVNDLHWLAMSLGVSSTLYLDDADEALARGREAIAVGARCDDEWAATWAKMISAVGAVSVFAIAEATEWAGQAFEEFGSLNDSWSRGTAGLSLAFALIQQGEMADANAALDEAIPGLLEVGDRKVASTCFIARALAARFSGATKDSAEAYAEALTLCLDSGDAGNTPVCLEGIAAAVTAADPERAAHLLGAARSLYDHGYVPWLPGHLTLFEATHAQLEEVLGDELPTLLAAGRISRLEDVRALDLSVSDATVA
jgi:predicted ATPase/class 3 adenylate cyclase